MQEPTTIQIEKRTRLRLMTYRITKRDTYDEMINRMLDVIDELKQPKQKNKKKESIAEEGMTTTEFLKKLKEKHPEYVHNT